jgi:hypothetical protein
MVTKMSTKMAKDGLTEENKARERRRDTILA